MTDDSPDKEAVRQILDVFFNVSLTKFLNKQFYMFVLYTDSDGIGSIVKNMLVKW